MSTLSIARDVPLAPYTTFGTGGAAQYFLSVTASADLKSLTDRAAEMPTLVLGGGSNLLVADSGFAGLVIKNEITGRSYEVKDDEVLATFGAGELLDAVVAETVAHGYWGLENLSHIPGTIGATPVQNVGAYGVEVSQLIDAVEAVHSTTGVSQWFTAKDCQFGYRDSFFKTPAGKPWIITQVRFRLSLSPRPILTYGDLRQLPDTTSQQAIRDRVIAIRSTKFPDWHTARTAGSFFKNPIISKAHYNQLQERYPDLPAYEVDDTHCKIPLGWVLDKVCQVRGHQVGKVGSYEGQALVVTATEGATTADIMDYADYLRTIVKQATDIAIEPEVTGVGF